LRKLRRASIRVQILILATLLVVLVSVIAMLSEPFIYGRHDKGVQIGLFAGRIEMILDQFGRAHSTAEEDAVLQSAEKLGISVEKTSLRQLPAQNDAANASDDIVQRVRALLDGEVLPSIENFLNGRTKPDVLYVKVDTDRALIFHMPIFPSYLWVAPAVASGTLKIVIPLALLAYFSSWLITGPLVSFAAAAKRVSADDSSEEPFDTEGASEIRSLAASLNVMRNRIQQMVVDRTRMLSAISHDLRTPLTRLRMRAERSTEPELRRMMLADITTLGSMIDESLAFLTNAPEVPRKVDLSSLLQTIATDFSDTGVDVTFTGPRRLTYICKPQGITRAISNLIENASRYATHIEVDLQSAAGGGVQIRVSDNGPGLTDHLKARVLEPFFKADEARQIGAGGGFGLGLPIVEGIVTTGHNGKFTLLDGKPNGLVVEISLPPVPADPAAKPSKAQEHTAFKWNH
jgi:signal transduction histidine kinase